MAHRSRPISSLAIAALLAGAATAHAQDGKRQAQALVTQGVKALQRKDYDDALEKFRAAYDAYPSPKILLDLGSTLRDMGRLAEAANTYERYLDDAGADAARTAEVKRILRDLDRRLDVLVIDVTPSGAEVAIDDGPWVPVGGRMQTRVAPGVHLVRARKSGLPPRETRIDGHPGGRDEVTIALDAPPPVAATPPPPAPIVSARANRVPPAAPAPAPAPPPPPRVAIEEPPPLLEPAPIVVVRAPRETRSPLGLSVESRIDGRLRGAAGSIGLVIDLAPPLELQLAALISHDAERVVPGGYAGLRLLAGERVRPFLGGGVPLVWSGDQARVAVRGSAGLELVATLHLTLVVELGVEHFFNPQPTYAATLFVPVVGLQGHY